MLDVEVPFIQELGFSLELSEGGESVVSFEPQRKHTNSFAVAHGGVVMTLLDAAMAAAARSVHKGMGVVTIEMKTSFMRPAPGVGNRLMAKGRIIRRTATLAFAEATLYDADGAVCAHATRTFQYVRRLVVKDRKVNDLDRPAGVVPTDY